MRNVYSKTVRSVKRACLIAVISMVTGMAAMLHAADGTWTNTTGGLWSDVTNWNSEVVADGIDSTADFSTLDITNHVVVNLDAPVTIGTLVFDDTDPLEELWWNIFDGGSATNTLSVTNVVVNSPAYDQGGAAIYPLIQGDIQLTKSGVGKLVLVGTNSYTGGTVVNGGILQVGNSGTTGSIGTGPVAIASGAELFYSFGAGGIARLPSGSNISGDGDLTALGGKVFINGDVTIGGDISLTQNGTSVAYGYGLDVNAHSTLSASSISLTGNIGQDNTARWNLNLDTSESNGPINLDVSIGRSGTWYNLNSFSADAGTGTVTLAGTRLGTGNAGFRSTPTTLSGKVNIPVDVWMESNVLTINAVEDSQISGALLGGLNLRKTGPGTLSMLNGDNTYSGSTTISEGTLVVDVQRFSSVVRHFDASTLDLADDDDVTQWDDLSANAAHATVPTDRSNGAPTYIADAGTGTGLGAVDFLKGTSTTDCQALIFNRMSNIRSVFSVFKGSSFLLMDTSQYHFHRTGDTNPADVLWHGTHASANIRNGSTYVNGALVNGTSYNMPTSEHNGYNLVEVITTGNVQANTFNRDRTSHAGNQSHAEVLLFSSPLVEEKRLEIERYLNKKWFGIGNGAGNGLPSGTAVVIENGATLDLSAGDRQTVGSLASSGGGEVLLGDNATLTVGGAGDTIFDGVISGTGASLVKEGSGTLTLRGANTYSGATIITGGVLRISYAETSYTNPVAGAARWFDASDLPMTNGEAVTLWSDLSGNAADAVNNTGSRIPAYEADAVNGLGAIHCDYDPDAVPNSNGTGNYLEFPDDNQIRTVFSIFKGSSFLLTDDNTYHFHSQSDAVPTYPLWNSSYASDNIKNGRTYVNGVLVDGTTYNMPTSLNNGFNLVEVVTTNGPVEASTFNNDRKTIHNGNQYHGEVILYDRVLTEEERLSVERYLLAKWFGQSFEGTLPASSSVVLGGDATLDPGGSVSSLGALTMVGNGTIALGDGSGSLSFADSRGELWTGTLTLTGILGPQSLRFGTNSSALTSEQLDSIVKGDSRFLLDSQGYLIERPAGTVILVR